MTQLKVSLLGAFELAVDDGRALRVETRKARALLAVLVMAKGRALGREHLAGLLWSRGEARQSLASLSQAIYSLRRATEEVCEHAIVAEKEVVAIDPSRFDVDVWRLERAAAEGGAEGGRRCLELHAGGFLEDLSIDAEEGFAEWRSAERARIEGLASGAGTAAMIEWERTPEAGDMTTVERLLSIDPYNEPAVRVLMRRLARQGRQGAAIEAGNGFAALLASDLGIEPSARLSDLAERIRAGAHGPAAPAAPAAPTVAAEAPRRPRAIRVALAAATAACLAAVVFWVVSYGGPGPVPDGSRLLVRPFEGGGGVPPGLAAGFSDDLATELVRRSTLDVLSRESGRLVAEGDDGASGASHVLRGRMRAEADRWTLNLWIVETRSGRAIWADRVRAHPDALRAMRDDLVARIADGIDAALLPRRAPRSIGLPDRAAPAYLKALGRLHAGTPQGNAEAVAPLEELVRAFPDAVEPAASLVLAYERIAFDAADYARAAGLHWREGYLRLKRQLARSKVDHPDILAARARLALRRLDHAAAKALARRALEIDASSVSALEVLARSLAATDETDDARRVAARAVMLSPASPQGGYGAIALAALADDDVDAAARAVAVAYASARRPTLGLLVMRAAVLGLGPDEAAARAAYDDLVAAAQSRPFAAWRIGDVAFANPRAATWSRPSPAEAANLVATSNRTVDALIAKGLARASGRAASIREAAAIAPLSPNAVAALMFGRRIAGKPTWLVRHEWAQTRSADGVVRQDGPFGPIVGAQEGRSYVIDGRLCDRWSTGGVEIESCNLVVFDEGSATHALIGEIGRLPFEMSERAVAPAD